VKGWGREEGGDLAKCDTAGNCFICPFGGIDIYTQGFSALRRVSGTRVTYVLVASKEAFSNKSRNIT
jgi:hypothetical protein